MIIFGGIFYFLKHEIFPDPPVGFSEVGVTEVTNVNEIEFIERINPSNSNKEYITNFPKLKKYVFSYGGKKWSYSNKEGSDRMVDFNKNIVNDFDLTPKEQETFIKELEKISGHEILEKAAEKKAAEKKALEKKALEKKPEKKAAKEKASDKKAAKDIAAEYEDMEIELQRKESIKSKI